MSKNEGRSNSQELLKTTIQLRPLTSQENIGSLYRPKTGNDAVQPQ